MTMTSKTPNRRTARPLQTLIAVLVAVALMPLTETRVHAQSLGESLVRGVVGAVIDRCANGGCRRTNRQNRNTNRRTTRTQRSTRTQRRTTTRSAARPKRVDPLAAYRGYYKNGKELKSLQTALNETGNNAGSPDGMFGSKTLNAVKGWQRSLGTSADGFLSNAERAALFSRTGRLADGSKAVLRRPPVSRYTVIRERFTKTDNGRMIEVRCASSGRSAVLRQVAERQWRSDGGAIAGFHDAAMQSCA